MKQIILHVYGLEKCILSAPVTIYSKYICVFLIQSSLSKILSGSREIFI